MRVFAFHHAGGGVESFSGWRRRLGADIELIPVRLPPPTNGRWRMAELVAELNRELDDDLRSPHLFYGHSMGALVAYHLSCLRASMDQRLPQRLLLGACAAPHLVTDLHQIADWSDERLAGRLLDLGGMPASLARLPRLHAAIVGRVREHFDIIRSAPIPETPDPLPCGFEVFIGEADPLVTVEQAAAWSAYTAADCEVHVLPGGHFYFRDAKGSFFTVLRSVLADAAVPSIR